MSVRKPLSEPVVFTATPRIEPVVFTATPRIGNAVRGHMAATPGIGPVAFAGASSAPGIRGYVAAPSQAKGEIEAMLLRLVEDVRDLRLKLGEQDRRISDVRDMVAEVGTMLMRLMRRFPKSGA